ncbi:hypothetical protein SPRG_06695 [Saprolegnia parasitica CBS 223.65]|uniref:Peptidase S9 prolyl oligopeptidase catalytic domain-containing protein n=1 Tax=Saprolegnia parasitica (strain CBS 223.65) TaxID=695850 RepID=A0A067CPI5_SAPPC|nr:hypothetical protein SPRG_06695 [Saprolegnia parasitica CBS 223.65]KDO28456.1 hypothetical protein SPRG_06695 [Saprolegnia parasitica CBS 223.65]|eukprot:XP_012200896.1 hypothetical protein SPRG_06695 [Saprolegnia parasitica CBS 223.65]
MVFDSAPSRATTKALRETWKGAGNLPSLGLSLGMRAFLVQLTLYPYVTRTANVFGLHWQRFFVEQAHIPKLFLYSNADEIVSAECVQAAIEDATARGSDVASVNYGQSPHVSHLATDPVGYTQHLQAFLDKHVR